MNLKQTVYQTVEETKLDIQRDLASKRIDNKGTASHSLRVDQVESSTGFNTTLVGVDYIQFLSDGRAPGKFPPVKMMEDWVKTKPADISPYMAGRKIALFGTAIYQDRSKGIELDKKEVILAARLKENLTKAVKENIVKSIKFK
jgi:hypothetical protein